MGKIDIENLEERIEKLEYDAPAVSDIERWNRAAWFIEQLIMENSVLRGAVTKAGIEIDETAQERANWMQTEWEKVQRRSEPRRN